MNYSKVANEAITILCHYNMVQHDINQSSSKAVNNTEQQSSK